MNKESIIEVEELELDRHKVELARLESKWFKSAKTNELIDFLTFYCKEKEIFINKIFNGD